MAAIPDFQVRKTQLSVRKRRLGFGKPTQPRDDFAQIPVELDFVKSQRARLPARNEGSWIVLRLTLGALASVGAVVSLLGQVRSIRGEVQFLSIPDKAP